MIPLPPEGVTAFLRACNPVDYSGFMEKMTLLGELLYETNESFNLTAIKPDGFWCRHVMEPFLVDVIRSCILPISVASVG